jgi:chromosome segregation ATPase
MFCYSWIILITFQKIVKMTKYIYISNYLRSSIMPKQTKQENQLKKSIIEHLENVISELEKEIVILENKVRELAQKMEIQKGHIFDMHLQLQEKDMVIDILKESNDGLMKECQKLREQLKEEKSRSEAIADSHQMLVNSIEIGVKRSRAWTPPRQIMHETSSDLPPPVKKERARAIKRRRRRLSIKRENKGT